MDSENVIKAWECCNPFNRKCNECPYEKDCYHDGISRHMVADAIAMLKEQEAVEGHWIVLEFCANEGIYCSKCMNKIFDRSTKPKKKLSNYCPNCGSKNTHFFNPSTEKIMYSD